MELSIIKIDNFQSSMVYLFPFLVDQRQFYTITWLDIDFNTADRFPASI